MVNTQVKQPKHRDSHLKIHVLEKLHLENYMSLGILGQYFVNDEKNMWICNFLEGRLGTGNKNIILVGLSINEYY